jgi:hypothetical protein
MSKVWHFQPYSITRNLGEEYNNYMRLIPDSDSCCFTDGDVLHLVPTYGQIIHEYAQAYPNAVLTSYTNRIHELAKGQLLPISNEIKPCIEYAEGIKGKREVTEINGSVSGFLLVVPKHIWKRFPFPETNQYKPGQPNLLGVDNGFTNQVRANGIKVLRMEGLFVWHSYRLLSNGLNKSHLL